MSIENIVKHFINRRPLVKENNTTPKVLEMLIDEVKEAQESIPEMLGSELADILWLVHSIAYLEGIDLNAEIEIKSVRNEFKYPESRLQEGNYDEIKDSLRDEWNEKGGDTVFYGRIRGC